MPIVVATKESYLWLDNVYRDLSDLVSRRQWIITSERSEDVMGIITVRAKRVRYPLPEDPKSLYSIF